MDPEPRRPVRVAVLNDYPVVIAGLDAMLRPYADRVTLAQGGEAMDLVLYDTFGSVYAHGEEQRLIEQYRHARLVVYSWSVEESLVKEALAAGASGYLPKMLTPDELVAALERVAAGEQVVPDARLHGRAAVSRASWWPGMHHGLSARESEMVALMVRGLSNQEIADAAYLSINSVKTYIRTAYRKMGVTTRAQAVLWAVRHGFDLASDDVT
jgi:two-component system, NarL family, response regulator LiaR